jgi:hypothetical protein
MPEGQLQPLLAGLEDSSSCKAAADEPKGALGISSVCWTPCWVQRVRGMTVHTQLVSLDCYVATVRGVLHNLCRPLPSPPSCLMQGSCLILHKMQTCVCVVPFCRAQVAAAQAAGLSGQRVAGTETDAGPAAVDDNTHPSLHMDGGSLRVLR